MAPKGWHIVEKSKNYVQFYIEKTDEALVVENVGGVWCLKVFPIEGATKIHKDFETKKEALAFALKYMKSHAYCDDGHHSFVMDGGKAPLDTGTRTCIDCGMKTGMNKRRH